MAAPRVWDIDSEHVQVSTGNVFYTYSRGPARPEHITSMVKNLGEFAALSNERIGYIFHVAQTASPPTVSDGARVTTMFNKYAARIAGVALVVEAKGFAGATLRSAVSLVFILKREGFMTKSFATATEAATWLAPLLEAPPSEIRALTQRAIDLVDMRSKQNK